MAGFFFEDDVNLVTDRIINKQMSAIQAIEVIKRLVNLFNEMPKITHDACKKPLRDLAKDMEIKVSYIFSLLRETLTGQKVSPPIFDVIDIFGKERTIERLEKAAKMFERMNTED
ncbi:hypothetical protein GF380_02060 [Candidatus Uhrbacteria bacterium]|nr:hypothetical protein [Candidatus Uhrbacteria bacterium]